MIIINMRKFFYFLIKSSFCFKSIQISIFVFLCIKALFHWSIIYGLTLYSYFLSHSLFYKIQQIPLMYTGNLSRYVTSILHGALVGNPRLFVKCELFWKYIKRKYLELKENFEDSYSDLRKYTDMINT